MISLHPISGGGERASVWVDLCQPSPDELSEASRQVGFTIPGRERISEIEFTSRVRRVGDAWILNLPRFQAEDGTVAPLGFVLSPQALVTQREVALECLRDIERDLDQHPCESALDLFLRILEHIVDGLADRLETLEARMGELTREAFAPGLRDRDLDRLLREIGAIGRYLGATHNAVHGLLRLANYLDEAPPQWFDEPAQHRLKLIHKDVASLSEFEQQLSDRIEFLLDSVLGLINMDQNGVMKLMAVASVVGIPPTVLVGIWGMNFALMPELRWHDAYFWALGVIGLSMLVPLAWFKRKGWI